MHDCIGSFNSVAGSLAGSDRENSPTAAGSLLRRDLRGGPLHPMKPKKVQAEEITPKFAACLKNRRRRIGYRSLRL